MPGGFNGSTSREGPPRGRAEVWRSGERGWRCLEVRLNQTISDAKAHGGPGVVVRWMPRGAPVLLADCAATLEAWQGNESIAPANNGRYSDSENERLRGLILTNPERLPNGALARLAREWGRGQGSVRQQVNRLRREREREGEW